MPQKSGYLLISGPEGVKEADTAKCMHCDRRWAISKDDKSFFCGRCHGPLCGKKECVTVCAPFMKQIEAAERKQILFQRLGIGH